MQAGAAPKEPQFAHPMKRARGESGLLALSAGYYLELVSTRLLYHVPRSLLSVTPRCIWPEVGELQLRWNLPDLWSITDASG